MRSVVAVITTGGGIPDSCEPPAPVVLSAPEVSLSMPVVLRGAKKLRVDTNFGGSFTAADGVVKQV
jgi:hypothetical protein